MVSVVYLLVPGRARPVAKVLATCEQKCTEMREAQSACQHLHSRLVGVFDVLQRRCSVGSPPVSDVFTKFSTLVSQFVGFLEHYGEQSLVYRVIKQRIIVDKLREINVNVGEVFNSVGMVTTWGWKGQLEQDIRVLNEVLEAMARDTTGVLRELKGFRAREEALLTLKFEVKQREDEHGEELVLLMRRMIATIGGAGASTAALPSWFVPLYELEMETDPFARGNFGSVYCGVWKSGTAVIVKRVQIDSMEVDEGVQLKIVKELDKLHELSHPNLIKMFGASHVAAPPYLVCKEANNENLGTFLARSTENKQQMWVLLYYQAAIGLDHLHKAGIVHGDLKLNNILVGCDGQAKVADFGLSTTRAYSRLSSSSSGGLRWRAPECLRRRPTFSSDVYSLGMSIIAAEIGEPPFAFLSDDDVRDNLRRGEIPDKPESMAACVWELVVSMTKANSTQRLPLEAVIDQLQVLARAPADSQRERCSVCSNAAENGSPICANCVDGVSFSQESSSSFDWAGGQSPPCSPTISSDHFSVGDVVNTLTKSSVIAQETALIFLIQACLDPEQRKLLHESNLARRTSLKCVRWAVSVGVRSLTARSRRVTLKFYKNKSATRQLRSTHILRRIYATTVSAPNSRL